MNKFFFFISILLIANVPEVAACKFISPKNKDIQYVGRWDKSNANDYHSYLGGAYFGIKFFGDQINIKLAVPVNIYVKLDDVPTVLFRKASGWVKITPDSLSNITHHLQVIAKFQDDEIQLEGLSVKKEGKLLKPDKKNFLAEFFGDSITSENRTSKGNTYEINADVPPMQIEYGKLKLGGSNPEGDKISVNSYYISLNNKPWFPVMGEFHFTRYPNQYWDEAIKKMKAGGINVISTYVFWNIHEETEGKFRWDGNRNLRKFIDLCKENNIYVIVRLGPFDHGEIRNGGLPDWLMGKPVMIRSNDPGYLFYVKNYTMKLVNN